MFGSNVMNDVTLILKAIERGDPLAADQLLPVVYEELRRLAAARLSQEPPGQTLQATALVHEAYLRLAGSEPAEGWSGRGHFFAAAAEAMRRILVESARRKQTLKRAGDGQRVDISLDDQLIQHSDDELIAVHEILDELASIDSEATQLVNLRFFAGMTMPEAATAMGIPLRTAERIWAYAKAWLFRRLHAGDI